MVQFVGPQTKCHKNLHTILNKLGFSVVDEARFGKYSIDCYVDELKMGFEADGKLYHWGSRDVERDNYIREKFGIKILRIPENLLYGDWSEVEDLILRFIDDKPI